MSLNAHKVFHLGTHECLFCSKTFGRADNPHTKIFNEHYKGCYQLPLYRNLQQLILFV